MFAQPGSVQLLRSLDGESILVNILTSAHLKAAHIPSKLAQTCAVMCLFCIGEMDNDVFTQVCMWMKNAF